MPPGRKPLDPAVKAERRQASLQRYAEKNKETLRKSAQVQMQRLRAAAATSPHVEAVMRLSAQKSAAVYREKNRLAICEADTMRRAQKYIENSGLEAFDEKTNRKIMARTQRRHEGHPPPPRPPQRTRAPLEKLPAKLPAPWPVQRPLAPLERPPHPPCPARRLPPQGRRLFLVRRSSSPEEGPLTPPARPNLKRTHPSSPQTPSPLPRKRRRRSCSSSESASSGEDSEQDSESESTDSGRRGGAEDTGGLVGRRKLPSWAMPSCPCGWVGCPQCACVCTATATYNPAHHED